MNRYRGNARPRAWGEQAHRSVRDSSGGGPRLPFTTVRFLTGKCLVVSGMRRVIRRSSIFSGERSAEQLSTSRFGCTARALLKALSSAARQPSRSRDSQQRDDRSQSSRHACRRARGCSLLMKRGKVALFAPSPRQTNQIAGYQATRETLEKRRLATDARHGPI